ncbi:MAG: PorV/PorQ family protein [Elusimicrobiales bacterium]|nr:PorV/PorQ family protein [Elusimicrobiales bacterium]
MRHTAALLLLLTLAAPAAAEPGLTAAQSLTAPLGARSAAMGQAFTAVAGGAESLNYNPGALAFSRGFSVTASYLRGFDDAGHSFIGAPLALGAVVLTPGYMHFNAGDIDLNLSDGTTGKVNAETDSAVYACAAWRLGGRLGLGATVKSVRLELAETATASSMLYDFGALYSAGRGLTFGAALLNTGRGFKFEEASDPAPALKRLGAAWQVEINPPNLLDPSTDLVYSDAVLSADWISPYKDRGYYQAGAELNMEMTMGLLVSLRAGYLFDRAAEGMTFGFGFAGKKLALDISFDTGKELNARQQAGLTYKF